MTKVNNNSSTNDIQNTHTVVHVIMLPVSEMKVPFYC